MKVTNPTPSRDEQVEALQMRVLQMEQDLAAIRERLQMAPILSRPPYDPCTTLLSHLNPKP